MNLSSRVESLPPSELIMSEPVLLPPFLPDLIDASDSGFPVRITGRCKRKLFWHIAKMDPYFGPALRITKPGDAA